jgi:hypothetical protein
MRAMETPLELFIVTMAQNLETLDLKPFDGRRKTFHFITYSFEHFIIGS